VLSPGSRLGPYEITGLLGAGGMGEVYRARDTRLGRDVAIKVLPAECASDPDRLRRFEQEARAVAALSHPNVLALFDIGSAVVSLRGAAGPEAISAQTSGLPRPQSGLAVTEGKQVHFLVTELLEGETLRTRLKVGSLPPHKTVEYGIQIAQGLSAAHEKGIVHRDLKPANVFITTDGHVKILDFGVAKLSQPRRGDKDAAVVSTVAEPTGPGAAIGTVGYMSPEQVRGLAVDHRTDIFAFGCVLHEMLSGRAPFLKETGADTVSAILHEDPPLLSGTGRAATPALQEIVSRCLEKSPQDRFSSAHDLTLALQVASSPGEAVPFAVAAAGTGAPAQRRSLLLGGGVLAVAVVVTALAIWRPWHGVSRPAGSVAERIPSILALPCKVYGAPEVAFLTDAVPGTISTLLAQVEGLDTKAPPTSFEVERMKGDLTKIADLYQVSSFIVTSITTSPGRFALNVQLVDAATRKVRWGKQYEGPREAYNDLARQAAEGIRLAVRPAASPVPTATVSSEAELALREGAYFWNRYGNLHHPPDFEASLAAFKRALKVDPSLAVAEAEIASLYRRKYENEGDPSGALKESEAWARRALDVDQRCGRAWAALSWVEMYSPKPDIERQLEYALKAASFSPRDAVSHMTVSNSVASPGAFSLNLAASLWAVDVDPLFLPASGNVVLALSALGRPEEALPFADRAMRLEPEAWSCQDTKGYVLLKLGRFEEARKTLARGEPQFFENPSAFLSQLWGQIRFQLAVAERDTAMIEKLERYLVPRLLDGRADALTLGNGTQFVCPGLALLGRTDESIRILLRSVEVGVPPPYDFLLYEPGFKPLRSDPRFAKVVTASRDGAAKIARVLEQARTRGELPSYLNQPLDELVKLLNAKGGTS